MARTVENPRKGFNRAVSSGSVGGGIDSNKLAREIGRLKTGSKRMTDALMEFNTPKSAWGAIKHGRILPEQAVEVAFNLRLIPNQLSTTANDAMELIKQAATSDYGSFDVAVNRVPKHEAAPTIVRNDGTRPLTREERRQARRQGKSANPTSAALPEIQLVPMRTAQQDALTGNGLQQPNQVGRDENQQETMRSLPTNEKWEHQNRGSDTIQTDSDNEPTQDGRGAPTRHAFETPQQKVVRLQEELKQAQREARQSTYLEKISRKIASLNEGQLAEVEAVVDELLTARLDETDQLYASAEADNVEFVPASRLSKGEIVSQEDISALLDGHESSEIS